MSEPVVGIDLGTTFSVISRLDGHGRPVTVPNAEGDLTTPSVVFLDGRGAVVGKEAIKAAEFEPERVARFPKRDMGRDAYRDSVRGERLPPEVLQALILRKLKQDAEMKLGSLKRAVITVPAYFNEPRRKATQDAGRMAGWDVIDIINEPTAAAIAFGVQRGFLDPAKCNEERETVLVYDLGGGTFDVTLMRIEHNSFTVLATAGDVELGGIDWDARIIDHLAAQFARRFGIDPRQMPAAMQRLRLEAEDAKRSLSTRENVTLSLSLDQHRLRVPFTRAEFEQITGDLLDRTVMTLRRLLRDADLKPTDLTRLLMVGGATRMPAIATILEKETGFRIDRSLSADEAVSHGAAIYANARVGNLAGELRVRNVNSHDLGVLGVEQASGLKRRHIMIPRNTPLPATRKQRFPTYRDNQRGVTVTVVEGGDASGTNATRIGECQVKQLPPNLPKGTAIEVEFAYAENGRLDVFARMPSVGKNAVMSIERATGMPESCIAGWTQAVQAGLPDGYERPTAMPPAIARKAPAAVISEPGPPVAAEPNPFDFRGAASAANNSIPVGIPVQPVIGVQLGNIPRATPVIAPAPTNDSSPLDPRSWFEAQEQAPPAPAPNENPLKFT